MQPIAHQPPQAEGSDERIASRDRPSLARILVGPLLAGLLAALIVLAVAFPGQPGPHARAQGAQESAHIAPR